MDANDELFNIRKKCFSVLKKINFDSSYELHNNNNLKMAEQIAIKSNYLGNKVFMHLLINDYFKNKNNTDINKLLEITDDIIFLKHFYSIFNDEYNHEILNEVNNLKNIIKEHERILNEYGKILNENNLILKEHSNQMLIKEENIESIKNIIESKLI